MTHSLIKLTQKLIKCPSTTPKDHSCHEIIINFLKKINFTIEKMYFKDTLNLWAYHTNEQHKNNKNTLLFLGHTDVVPPGNLKIWKYPPFSGHIHNNILYGRGASDMKGALAAMLIATKQFIKKYPHHLGKLTFLITSDEEGTGINGTVKAIKSLIKRNEHIDYCVIGEPSSHKKIGDVIKNGRRGSLTGKIKIYGKSGHVAYPQFLKNPIHLSVPALLDILNTQWDQKPSIFFPPTTIQIINVYSDNFCNNNNNNVTPYQIMLKFNIRFNDQTSIYNIKQKIHNILKYHKLTYYIHWKHSAELYLSKSGELLKTTTRIIEKIQKITPKLETTGGTSDGRFISKTGSEIIELGALNNTIHQENECIFLHHLEELKIIYQKILEKILI